MSLPQVVTSRMYSLGMSLWAYLKFKDIDNGKSHFCPKDFQLLEVISKYYKIIYNLLCIFITYAQKYTYGFAHMFP